MCHADKLCCCVHVWHAPAFGMPLICMSLIAMICLAQIRMIIRRNRTELVPFFVLCHVATHKPPDKGIMMPLVAILGFAAYLAHVGSQVPSVFQDGGVLQLMSLPAHIHCRYRNRCGGSVTTSYSTLYAPPSSSPLPRVHNVTLVSVTYERDRQRGQVTKVLKTILWKSIWWVRISGRMSIPAICIFFLCRCYIHFAVLPCQALCALLRVVSSRIGAVAGMAFSHSS